MCLQKKADCAKPPAVKEPHPKAATSAANCDSLFSSPDSPLSPCFRVVSTIAAPSSQPTPAVTFFINHCTGDRWFISVTRLRAHDRVDTASAEPRAPHVATTMQNNPQNTWSWVVSSRSVQLEWREFGVYSRMKLQPGLHKQCNCACELQGVKRRLLFCSQVDPAQFWSMCASSSSTASCRLAHAFVYLCQQNYIPLEVPAKCCKLILHLSLFMRPSIIVRTKHMALTSGLLFCFVVATVVIPSLMWFTFLFPVKLWWTDEPRGGPHDCLTSVSC